MGSVHFRVKRIDIEIARQALATFLDNDDRDDRNDIDGSRDADDNDDRDGSSDADAAANSPNDRGDD